MSQPCWRLVSGKSSGLHCFLRISWLEICSGAVRCRAHNTDLSIQTQNSKIPLGGINGNRSSTPVNGLIPVSILTSREPLKDGPVGLSVCQFETEFRSRLTLARPKGPGVQLRDADLGEGLRSFHCGIPTLGMAWQPMYKYLFFAWARVLFLGVC